MYVGVAEAQVTAGRTCRPKTYGSPSTVCKNFYPGLAGKYCVLALLTFCGDANCALGGVRGRQEQAGTSRKAEGKVEI